ncbi:MAG: putative protein kinase UbiB [Myxococcota bacterium]|nr:putative protein kinase UbiB [Myxococcota bacterium]
MSAIGKVVTNLRRGQALIKDVGRFRDISVVLINYGFGEVLRRIELPEAVPFSGLLEKAKPKDVARLSTAERLFLAIQELGPTFVKLGQILSTREDLIPPEYVEQFSKLQDQVSSFSWEEARQRVENALGGPIEAHFGSFQEQPIASASIAQVHRATLKDGTPVAVKVMRPGIREKIESDINILYFLARSVEKAIPEAQLADLTGIINEFDRAISRELDFTIEARNLSRFSGNFQGTPGVRFPKPFLDLCRPEVLVMEFIEGAKVTDAYASGKFDGAQIAQTLADVVFRMLLRDGFFHGDLHPGNVLIEPNGTVAILDCGMAGRLTPLMKDRVIDMLMAMSRQDWQRIAEIYYEIGVKTAPVPFDAFQADVIDVMEEYLVNKRLDEVEIGAFFSKLIDGAVKYRLKMPPDYTMMFKALMTVEGLGKTIYPDLDIIAQARPYVEEALRQRYAPEKITRDLLQSIESLNRLLRMAPRTGREILAGIENGRVKFGVELDRLDLLAESLKRQANLQSAGMMTAGLAIASALIHGKDPAWLGNLGWILTAAAVGWIILQILRPVK